jgi:hypothetical protein
MSKTIAMTLEVITRSTVTVLVDVPDEVAPSHYHALGKKLYESTPEAMFSRVERRYDRVSFEKTDEPAYLVASVNSEGEAKVSQKDARVELEVSDSVDLKSDRHVVMCVGVDEMKRELVLSPLDLHELSGGTAKVHPFTEEAKGLALNKIAQSFGYKALPDTWVLNFEPFSEQELKYISAGDWYLEVTVKVRKQRHAFTLSTWDEFSNFAFGAYGDPVEELGRADIEQLYPRFEKERSVACEPLR